MNTETVFVVFQAMKSWNPLPAGVTVSSPHNGEFTSSSLQILSFPLESVARYLTPVGSNVLTVDIIINWICSFLYIFLIQLAEDVEITSRKTKTKEFKPLPDPFKKEANEIFPRMGDQLSYIQQALANYNKHKSEKNLEIVHEYLKGLVEIVVIDGTGRELKESPLLVSQENTKIPVPSRGSKVEKNQELVILPSQRRFGFFKV
jgi:hypothetical protein